MVLPKHFFLVANTVAAQESLPELWFRGVRRPPHRTTCAISKMNIPSWATQPCWIGTFCPYSVAVVVAALVLVNCSASLLIAGHDDLADVLIVV